MRLTTILHVIILVVWLAAAVVLALGIATLGNEEAVLSKQRGADRKEQRQLAVDREQLRSALQWEARREALVLAVRDLHLPLEAPAGTAPSSDGNVELALSNEDQGR